PPPRGLNQRAIPTNNKTVIPANNKLVIPAKAGIQSPPPPPNPPTPPQPPPNRPRPPPSPPPPPPPPPPRRNQPPPPPPPPPHTAPMEPRPATFAARRTHHTKPWRQHAALDLAPLATAVREGDTPTALALLRSGNLSGVHFHESLTDPLQTHRDHLLTHWRALANANNPAEALALAARLRLLTAVRDGPQGARSLNACIEAMLGEPGTHFHGRLLLITENSYRHRLFNGDIGICLRGEAGAILA